MYFATAMAAILAILGGADVTTCVDDNECFNRSTWSCAEVTSGGEGAACVTDHIPHNTSCACGVPLGICVNISAT